MLGEVQEYVSSTLGQLTAIMEHGGFGVDWEKKRNILYKLDNQEGVNSLKEVMSIIHKVAIETRLGEGGTKTVK